jgi:membrane AbrB-like protein
MAYYRSVMIKGLPRPAAGLAVTGRTIFVLLRTVAIAIAGGGLLTVLGLPAAWLSGAVIAVGIAAVAGLDTRVPDAVTTGVMILVGATLGAGATPETVKQAAEWPLSLIFLVVTMVVVQVAAQVFFRRISGWDRETSFYAAIPGVMSLVLALASVSRADMARVVVAQSLRVFLLIALTPSFVNLIGPLNAGAGAIVRPVASPRDIVVTLAAAAAGGLLFRLLRVPAAPLFGALAASTAIHAAGLAAGVFPWPLLLAGFVGIGAIAGSRFAGTDLVTLRDTALASLGGFVVAVGISAPCAWLVATLLGRSFGEVMLAYAPGSLDVMTTLAFALGLDTAFVAAHQFMRFIIVALSLPVWARLMTSAPSNDPSGPA